MDSERPPSLRAQCAALGEGLARQGLRVAVAESCTGGLVAATLTDIPGSSRWFEYGFVTYSASAKQTILGLPAALVEDDHIVSEPTAIAMARAAQALSGADTAIGITGIAGPSGGRPPCPVGTVVIAWANRAAAEVQTFHFSGNRQAVRWAAVVSAVAGLTVRLDRGFLARS
ncbi:MAG: CinA family protein [Acidiferrobacter sp.]